MRRVGLALSSRVSALVPVLLLVAACTTAHAVKVTLCSTDTQAPAGGKSVNLAQALQAGGSVTFDCGGPATIRFTRTHVIRVDTQVDGGGTVTLDGNGNALGRFDGENDAATLRLTSLSILRGGRASPPPSPGGAIGSIGRRMGGVVRGHWRSVELNAVTIRESWFAVWLTSGRIRALASTFENNDGGVLIGGAIEVGDHTRFSSNRGSPISSEGGVVTIDRSEFLSNAGPVSVLKGNLRVSHATFTNHQVADDGGAIRTGADTVVEESTFTNNVATHGGAIFVGSAGTVSIRASRFRDNQARQSGGAIAFARVPVPVALTLRHVTFERNRAAVNGGALALQRDLRQPVTLDGGAVAFIANRATQRGGAIDAPDASIRLVRGVFVDNQAGKEGGAVAALQQGAHEARFANTLLVRNTAPQGAAFWGNAAAFINATIADNTGTAVWARALPIGPLPTMKTVFPIRFVNTVVAGTTSGACGPLTSGVPYTDGGHNLQFPGGSCGAAIDSRWPFLGAYYVPLFWSPVIGHGDPAVCDAVPIARKDLYNARRPQGLATACAIGAVEGDIAHLLHRWTSREDGVLSMRR